VTHAYLRIIRDANETFRAFFRQDEEKAWVPFAPAVHLALGNVTVGVYAAHCEPPDETLSRGVASAEFDFLRSRGAGALGRTMGAAGGSGLLIERRWTRGGRAADPEVTLDAAGGAGANATELAEAIRLAGAAAGDAGVAAVRVRPGAFAAGGAAAPGEARRLVLRGDVGPADYAAMWGASGARFVLSDRHRTSPLGKGVCSRDTGRGNSREGGGGLSRVHKPTSGAAHDTVELRMTRRSCVRWQVRGGVQRLRGEPLLERNGLGVRPAPFELCWSSYVLSYGRRHLQRAVHCGDKAPRRDRDETSTQLTRRLALWAQVPRVVHHNVTIEEVATPAGGRYALAIDGEPRRTLTVFRPASQRLTTVPPPALLRPRPLARPGAGSIRPSARRTRACLGDLRPVPYRLRPVPYRLRPVRYRR